MRRIVLLLAFLLVSDSMLLAADAAHAVHAADAAVNADNAKTGEVASVSDGKRDAQTGLAIAPDWELAKAHCGVCHSYRLVTANRGDREYWLQTLRWMQRTQNLWPIPPEQEGKLLDYLAANYSESEWGRRPPLSPTLLPKR